MMTHKTFLFIALAVCLGPVICAAEDTPSSAAPEKKEAIKSKIEEHISAVKTELKLSDEQMEKITPIIKESIESQRAVLERYGIDLEHPEAQSRERLGFRKARELAKDLAAVREETAGKLEKILTKEQMEQFKALQEKRREELRAQIRERRNR